MIYHQQGDHDKALAAIDRALQLQPDEAIFYNRRGLIYDDIGEHDKAFSSYDQGLQIDPNNDSITPNTPNTCLLYTSPSPRDRQKSRMPSSA